MKSIPKTENTPLLRTDFADDGAWKSVIAAVEAPVGEFRAYVTPLSDPEFDHATIDQVVQSASQAHHRFVLVADRVAMNEPEHTVLVVDTAKEPGRWFRVIPSEAWSVENNLSIANMEFEEFAEAAGGDRVFRGFAHLTHPLVS